MPPKKDSQEEKDYSFVQKVRYILAFGAHASIIYYFTEKPTQDYLTQLTRQFPYANVLFIDYKDKDSYCISFQSQSPHDKHIEYALNLENIDAFLSTVNRYRATQKK